MKRLLVLSALLIVTAISRTAWADAKSVCLTARDKANNIKTAVVNSHVQWDLGGNLVKGLRDKFCVFTGADDMGAIDLQTLASKRPSIAATYLLQGLDLEALPTPHPDSNPGRAYCESLSGSSVSRYDDGGFLMPGGQDEVCVFGDGSKISIWTLIEVSLNPQFLSMRKAVRSQPLPLFLPYIAQ